MLTILFDPAGISGRHRFALDTSKTIQENIERHMASGYECDLLINGVKVDPLSCADLDRFPSESDAVTIIRRPSGGLINTLSYGILGGYVAQQVMPVPQVAAQAPSNVSKDSPNNSLTSQSNVARAYQAIPDVYGYRRVWPDLIQPSIVEYIDQIKYVTEWLCISRGKGDVSEVQYSETPIGDIAGASYSIFEPAASSGYPEHSETTLTDVLEAFASDDVNGQELPPPVAFSSLSLTGDVAGLDTESTFTVAVADGPSLEQLKTLAPSGSAVVGFTYQPEIIDPMDPPPPVAYSKTCTLLGFVVATGVCTLTFSTSPAWSGDVAETAIAVSIVPIGYVYNIQGPYTLAVQCSRIRWNTVFLRGLKGTVNLRVEWWQIDDADAEISGTRDHHDASYTADTYDQRFYTDEVTPSAGSGRYRIQFSRRNDQIGDGSADVAKLEEVYAVRHYATKVLPGVTVIRLTTKATNQATGYSDRKFNVRWQRHVRTLSSPTVSASRNFARSMAHIWSISGNDISGLDVAALAAINADLGESSPLLRFDCSIDDADMSLGERLQMVANNARCVVWRNGTQWTVTRDQARPYPELQLDYRNLAASGDSVISYSAHLPATNDGVEIEYVDEVGQSKKAYVRLNISSGSPVSGTCSNPKKIRLPGCTTQDQAENRAQLEARRLLYQRIIVRETALSDGASLGILSVVRWIDPNDFAGDDGLQAGEVLEINGLTIKTSEQLDWKGATTGRVLFTGKDGAHIGAPVVCTPTDSGMVLSSIQDGLYVADAGRQCGSRYAFAVGVTDAEMEASGLYSVTEVQPTQSGEVSLALTQYDARMYEAD